MAYEPDLVSIQIHGVQFAPAHALQITPAPISALH